MGGKVNGTMYVIEQLGQALAHANETIAQLRRENEALHAGVESEQAQ